MNNPYIHRRRSELPSQRTFSVAKKQACQTISHTTLQMGAPSLNPQFLNARRENYLNTGYNNRRQKLKDITTENIKIYLKINSQKSAYSRDELRKSYESNASISRRLSQSKISKRSSSSRSSQRSSQVRNPKSKLKTVSAYQIQTNSVSNMKQQELAKLKTIFKRGPYNMNPRSVSSINHEEGSRKIRRQIDENEELKKSIKLRLPVIRKPQLVKMPTAPKKYRDGQFLHIIAEEMFGKQKHKN